MIEEGLILLTLILSTMFSGIVIFLSTVLRNTFNAISIDTFYVSFCEIIRNGRKSIIINAIVLIPIIIFVIYLILGYRNPLYIIGFSLYFVGSFLSSRIINEPIYSKLLSSTDSQEIETLRGKLNTGNAIRAIVSFLGITVLSLSLLF